MDATNDEGASAAAGVPFIPERLEQLRGCIRAENISYGEIAELQSLAEHIDPGDVELLQWAGVPEHPTRFQGDSPRIRVGDEGWEPNDALTDPRWCLHARLTLNGMPMHLEAWEVHTDADGLQEAVADEYKDDFELAHHAFHADGHFQTITIMGRDYVVFASPHC